MGYIWLSVAMASKPDVKKTPAKNDPITANKVMPDNIGNTINCLLAFSTLSAFIAIFQPLDNLVNIVVCGYGSVSKYMYIFQ